MKYAIIKKEDVAKWLAHLQKSANLYAPAKKENLFVFKEVEDVSSVTLEYIPTIIPPKKYYLPKREKLFNFSINPFKTSKSIEKFEETVIFGAHTCDIAGIQCLDVVFRDNPEDTSYLNRKENTSVIGIECLKYCDEYANCTSMGNHVPRGGYDLMLVDIRKAFIIHINSEKGQKLISGLNYIKEASQEDIALLDAVRAKKKEVFKAELTAGLPEVYEAFDKSFNSKVWDDVGKRCVACGNCTAVCPTCYCFDVADEMELSFNEGSRFRIWNSCQMDDFAKVAAGEDFRKGRPARQRHRYYRKFKYPVDKFNRYFCTGCGRCTRACMAGISLKDTVNELTQKEKANA